MTDECLSTQEGSGSLRRCILQFVAKDPSRILSDVLQSGKYVEAEEAFENGFQGVLRHVNAADKVIILDAIGRMSTTSGRGPSPQSVERFIRMVSGALSDHQDMAVSVFSRYIEHRPVLDPRLALWFVACHIKPLVEAEPVLRPVFGQLRAWSQQTCDIWKREEGRGELSSKALIPKFANAVADYMVVGLSRGAQNNGRTLWMDLGLH